MTRPARHRRGRRKASVPKGHREVTVDSLGAQGDGVARDGNRVLYIPFTLPGETARVRLREKRGEGFLAEAEAILAPSPLRAVPPCPHFGRCGGCALQHLDGEALATWKRDQVANALARRGLGAVSVEDTFQIPPGNRRRASLAAFRGHAGVVFGFNARFSHHVVPIEQCQLLSASLQSFLAPLRALLEEIMPPETRGQAVLTETENGIDVVLAPPGEPTLPIRESLAVFAERNGIARLCWRSAEGRLPEPIALRHPPVVRFDGIAVEIPPGAFLQPSIAGEAALTRLVKDGIGDGNRLVDLFSGLGTFTLPLARTARVLAVEHDAEALRALDRAAGRANLGGRVETEARNLDRRPLTPKELAPFAAAVFDPPRAGAASQAEALAATPTLDRVVGVSCNPATFARDARTLIDGGFRLVRVVPVDQFPYTAHVEVVGHFLR